MSSFFQLEPFFLSAVTAVPSTSVAFATFQMAASNLTIIESLSNKCHHNTLFFLVRLARTHYNGRRIKCEG